MAGTGTPPREKARVYRTGRPDRLCSLLFAVAALILCAGIGAVLWHEWQGTRPTAAEQAEADEIERADGGEEEIAAVTEEAADGKIVVAIDPGHGGVNPSVGGEDAGSLGSGLREADVTLKTATLVYDKLARDGRFAPMLTANGTEYLKPSRRAARAKAAGAQLLLSIHLNYDADSCVSGFECCPATPQLSTNADSLRFARLVAEKFGAMGMELRGIDGVRYTPEDLSAATWAGYKRFTDADGNAVYTYVRRYARFADAEVPAGTVSLTGILQYDAAGDGRYILKLRDENDCTH